MNTGKPRNKYIDNLISKMTLEQKIGALMTLHFTGVVPTQNVRDYITKYHCGGLRLTPITRRAGNDADPKTCYGIDTVFSNLRYTEAPPCTPAEYKQTLSEYRKLAKERPLSLPLHFSYDQEGGIGSNQYFGNLFPQPMGIRATNDPKMAYYVARAIAEQGRAMGLSWIHSPDVDINSDPRNPECNVRTYSDNAEDVTEYALEACRGFREGGLIATAKHFPGRGFSNVDAHFEVPTINVDKKTMYERELAPYRKLIEQGDLPAIMIAHSIFPAFDPDHIATVSRKIITGLLREELGFEGVITTDSMTMGGISKRYGVAEACALALEAGADIVLMKAQNHLVADTFNAIRSFVEQGRIPVEELDKKVYRVLNMKYEYGLFHDYDWEDIDPDEVVKKSRLVQLSKDVARRSILIARDEENLLPLKPEERVLVIEQKIFAYNTRQWHSGIHFENCVRHSENVEYLETLFRWDELDLQRINTIIGSYDKVVITNFYNREIGCNLAALNRLLENHKNVIVVTDTPYQEISIPKNAKTVVLSFAPTPNHAEVVAGVLYGKIHPEGVWPIEKHI